MDSIRLCDIDRPNSVCGEDVTFQDYPARSIGITVWGSDAELFVQLREGNRKL